MAGGVGGSRTDCTGGVAVIVAGAGGVAGADECVTDVSTGAGGGEEDAALAETGLGMGTYITPGGSVGGTRIGVIHGASGLCHVMSRENTTLPVSSSNSL